ncbi:class I SAM-dependent DNA methyltransferase [Geothrix sp. PMB-07]|uniref:HsdM family class I SAM-dependent methyltransferase n=1 Tax=Geothrix sp. PMB-07 TaxID=3068640 RepID=UPI002741610B|nr:N-6 DNA methylase [Geothrix sp. PMB-07]WLT33350.1 N-6 DNA methylase [Geothrix sp. PMB-07]
MNSVPFRRALQASGYLSEDGTPVPGLETQGGHSTLRVRPIFANKQIGLCADAIFTAQGTPIAIFKDAGWSEPSIEEITRWHEIAWNIGLAPLLWIITPTEIRLHNCFATPSSTDGDGHASSAVDRFLLKEESDLQRLNAACGRIATETGAFWSSEIGKKIDRQYRVDQELLGEISALEERLTALAPANGTPHENIAREKHVSREFAQRLIGRCIFFSYLLDRQIAQPFLPTNISSNISESFETVESAFALFRWLRETFNGDLFPMDDPGAEQERLGQAHLILLRDFVEGQSLIPKNCGKRRLFRFQFNAIPVDLISSIYQQFARSSSEVEAASQGLHYTPVELVHLTLDPVFEGLASTARVIDPTCGSGAFLVEAFRRLVWKGAPNGRPSRSLIRKILYEQLFGIDINKSALGIAAFSLYLAAMELDEDPVLEITDLKFHRLIGSTLHEADTLSEVLPEQINQIEFDAVVGNPPWTFVRREGLRTRSNSERRPRRSPDHGFLKVASRFACENGRIGMVMKASPFFSKDEHAVASRMELLQNLAPVALVNLSQLRKEKLFPDADGPALLFFSRCKLIPNREKLLVGSIPWSPDFRRTGIFQVGPGDLRSISLDRVAKNPAMLKAATFGTVRDSWLIERLECEFPTLESVLNDLEIRPSFNRGQGFQVVGDENSPPDLFYKLPMLMPDEFVPLRINRRALPDFEYEFLHRTRDEGIYKGPLLICPKACFSSALEPGRYSSTYYARGVVYSESFYGISFAGKDQRFARVLNAIMNSSVTAFQFAFGGGVWGLERPTVEPKDLLALRIPRLMDLSDSQIDEVLSIEEMISRDPSNRSLLVKLDEAVSNLFDLNLDERIVVQDSVSRAGMLIFDGRSQRLKYTELPSQDLLKSYAETVVTTVNRYLKARGKRHLEAVIYPHPPPRPSFSRSESPMSVVSFSMEAGSPGDHELIGISAISGNDLVRRLLSGAENPNVPPYLNERKHVRIYAGPALFILKPAEIRYWTDVYALNDADMILADHWVKGKSC